MLLRAAAVKQHPAASFPQQPAYQLLLLSPSLFPDVSWIAESRTLVQWALWASTWTALQALPMILLLLRCLPVGQHPAQQYQAAPQLDGALPPLIPVHLQGLRRQLRRSFSLCQPTHFKRVLPAVMTTPPRAIRSPQVTPHPRPSPSTWGLSLPPRQRLGAPCLALSMLPQTCMTNWC